MEHKKDLGKLFKERLADTEMAPKKSLWPDIEKTLDRKKRRRFYFIWLASLLGVLLVGLILLVQVFKKEPVKNFEDDIFQIAPENTDANSDFEKIKSDRQINEKIGIDRDNTTDSLYHSTTVSNGNNLPDTKLDPEQGGLKKNNSSVIEPVDLEGEKKSASTKFKKEKKNGEVLKKSSYENNTDDERFTNIRTEGIENSPVNSGNSEFGSRIGNTDSANSNLQTQIDRNYKSLNTAGSDLKPSRNNLNNQNSRNTDYSPIDGPKKDVLENDGSYTKNPPGNLSSEIADSAGKKSVLSNLKDNKIDIAQSNSIPIDSLTKTRPQPKKIEKDSVTLLSPEEKRVRTHQIYPFVGTSSYGALSKKSTIDARLDDNTKNSSPELSYGVLMVFEITEKLAVRIGAIHNSLEKSTLNVPIDPNGLNTNYAGIEYGDNSNYLTFSNRFTVPEEITLTEKLSYFEIPLNMSYNLWQKGILRFDAIGGVGVSRLTKNEILYIRPSGESGILGENRSYAQGSFGFHLGLGVDFRINEYLQLHLEPIIKPQLGLYDNKISNNPYIFNLHFGMKYRL